MANQKHVTQLKADVAAWNEWREANPDVQPDLSEANLREANLRDADLSSADLRDADLRDADLRDAHIAFTDLGHADLSHADLSHAHLNHADLLYADLSHADLSHAHLSHAHLLYVDLRDADLRDASLLETGFINVDLSAARGLETCYHLGPSVIDRRTLARSGPLPLAFLQGCGLSDWEIEATNLYRKGLSEQEIIDITYRIAAIKTQHPVGYQSCFISYTESDKAYAEKLYAALQEEGVRCWFAPEDLKIGDRLQTRIDEAIYGHQKLLLILSASSMESSWVEREVEIAMARELEEKSDVLFPIRLDEAVIESPTGWAARIRNTRHIGDFRQWQSKAGFQEGFTRLLRDLHGVSGEAP